MYNANNRLLKSAIAMAVLYGIQFLVIPIVFSNTGEHIFYISTTIFVLASFLTLHDTLRFWLLSIFIYVALIFLYHPPGAYGIGTTAIGFPIIDGSGGVGSGYHREDAWLEITIMTIILAAIEILVWCVVKLVKAIRARKQ